MRRGLSLIVAVILGITTAPAFATVKGRPVHAIALHGEPKHGPNFEHFDYVNPDAPKGGTLTLPNANDQTFDTFNPFTLRGTSARGTGLIFETLMTNGDNEPFTMYCMICQTVEVAEDNSWVEFVIRPEARFQDGASITAEDVKFTFDILTEQGAPVYRIYYADVDRVEVRGELNVRFIFKTTENPELPSIIGQLPVVSKAYWEGKDFSDTTLEPPLGSGPYIVDSFEVGRFIIYKRNPDYWARDLNVVRGMFNFDRVRYEYFRDDTVRFEAFKTGGFDLHNERTAARWATAYNFPAFENGHVKKLEVTAGTPMGAQGFTWNLRRSKFQDRRVREALNLAFDFESLNRTIFYDQYTRLRSYWQRSELEAKGLPTPEELELLEPLKDLIPPEVFTQEFSQPVTSEGSGPRDNLLKARALLEQAGWENVNGELVNRASGEKFNFEILLVQASLDRIVLPWFQNLERLGIKGNIRVVDVSQFINRVNEFDFDVIVGGVQNSLSPGNEQAEYWGSESADRPGSRNYGGVKDPAIDKLIETIIAAPTRENLVTASHALDRVLTWNYFTVLHYGSLAERYAYWSNKIQRPDTFPLMGFPAPGTGAIATWWAVSNAADQAADTDQPVAGDGASSGMPWLPLAFVLGSLIVFFAVRHRNRSNT